MPQTIIVFCDDWSMFGLFKTVILWHLILSIIVLCTLYVYRKEYNLSLYYLQRINKHSINKTEIFIVKQNMTRRF